jgi:hypothetical protein
LNRLILEQYYWEGGYRDDERTPMKINLLISSALLLAAGIVLASCEKTPNGEPGAETQRSDGSKTSAPEEAGGGRAVTPGAQEKEMQAQGGEAADRAGQSAAQGAPLINEQQNKDRQHEPTTKGQNATALNQNEPNSTPSTQAQDQSPKSKEQEGQSELAEQKANPSSQASEPLQQRQAPEPEQAQRQNEAQQSQRQNDPQKTQSPGSQQNAAGAVGGIVNLSRDQIRQAQIILKQKGFEVGDLDGKLGPRTRKALMAYQQQQGLQATGQMDQQTVSALGIGHGSGQDIHSPGATTGQGRAGTP